MNETFFKECTNKPINKPNCPTNWQIISKIAYNNVYILKVKFEGCPNFGGNKILMYKGKFKNREYLDPHSNDNDDSPIARFKPNEEGMELANKLAKLLSSEKVN